MKTQVFYVLTVLMLFLIPNVNFGQAPNLGTASSFALFTAAGAFGNTGTTVVTGDIGSNSAVVTGFPPGTVNGIIYYPPHSTLAQAALDVAAAYSDLSGRTCGVVLGTTLGGGQILTPNTYCTGAASTLNGNLILDGQGNANALFIIKIGGAFATGTFSSVTLINSASLCNVYWQIGGQFDMGDYSVFRGTVLVNGAINLLEGSSLSGRCLSQAGAINLHNNIVKFLPAASGVITGLATVCQGQNAVNYTVPLIADATSYIWTLPVGATGISSTNSINVDYESSAVSGNITVKGHNTCGGDGAISILAITVSPLPLISAISHQ